jgi:hypothetical protein
MTWHVAAFFETIDNVAGTDVNALADQVLSIQNNHFVLDRPMDLIAAMAMSATLTRARVASATMRMVANPYIRPTITAAIPPANPNIWLLDHSPFRIPPYEEIQCLATSGVAMTEPFTALIFLSTGVERVTQGNIYPIRWTSTTAAVANTWTDLTITFEDTLPSGVYEMVLSECASTNAQAHRWIVPNLYWRPGFPSVAAAGSRLPYAISEGQWGAMGRFRSNNLPRVQVLVNGTDNSHTGFLHVVKVADLGQGGF